MGTMRVVEAGEEIYQGETRKSGELQFALAKIPGCVNYRRFCETLDLKEDDFSLNNGAILTMPSVSSRPSMSRRKSKT